MRRITPGITKPVGRVAYGERVCAVTTTDGMVLKADTSYRVGDPIMGPDNRVHWVENIHPPRPLDSRNSSAYRLL